MHSRAHSNHLLDGMNWVCFVVSLTFILDLDFDFHLYFPFVQTRHAVQTATERAFFLKQISINNNRYWKFWFGIAFYMKQYKTVWKCVAVCYLLAILRMQNAKIISKIRYPFMKWWCVKTLQYNFSVPLINANFSNAILWNTVYYHRSWRKERWAASSLLSHSLQDVCQLALIRSSLWDCKSCSSDHLTKRQWRHETHSIQRQHVYDSRVIMCQKCFVNVYIKIYCRPKFSFDIWIEKIERKILMNKMKAVSIKRARGRVDGEKEQKESGALRLWMITH